MVDNNRVPLPMKGIDMTLPTGTLVRVHKNLNRQKAGHREQWSVCVKIAGKGWRLHHHAETVTLTDATPIVSHKGVDRIRAKQSREVVAKIEGTLAAGELRNSQWLEAVDMVTVHFNPFRAYDFTKNNTESIFKYASVAYFPAQSAHFLAV